MKSAKDSTTIYSLSDRKEEGRATALSVVVAISGGALTKCSGFADSGTYG